MGNKKITRKFKIIIFLQKYLLYIKKYLGQAYTSNKTCKTRLTININEHKNSNKKTYRDVSQRSSSNFRRKGHGPQYWAGVFQSTQLATYLVKYSLVPVLLI